MNSAQPRETIADRRIGIGWDEIVADLSRETAAPEGKSRTGDGWDEVIDAVNMKHQTGETP